MSKMLEHKIFLISLCFIFLCLHSVSGGMDINGNKKRKCEKQGLYDSYVYSDSIFPFIKGHKILFICRQVNNCYRKAVAIHSQKKPLYLKTVIDEKNSDNFIKWLKSIDFCIAIDKRQDFLFSEGNKKCKEIIDLLENKLKELSLYDTYKNVHLLKHFEHMNIDRLHVKHLAKENVSLIIRPPQGLQQLEITSRYVRDEHLLYLPKTLKILRLCSDGQTITDNCNITGKYFDCLANCLETLVLACDIRYIAKHIKKLKNLKFLDLRRASGDSLGSPAFPVRLKEVVFGQNFETRKNNVFDLQYLLDMHGFSINHWIKALPKGMEIIDISLVKGDFEDKCFQNIFKNFKSLKTLKVRNLKQLQEKQLKCMPSTLKNVYVKWRHYKEECSCDCFHYGRHDCGIDYEGKHNQVHIIKALKKNRIKVKTLNGKEFPKEDRCDCDKCIKKLQVGIRMDSQDGSYQAIVLGGHKDAFGGKTFNIKF